MNSIDILEEKEKRLGAYLAVLNEENILYKKEDAIEGIIKLFKTLIAENKELKEKNEKIKQEYINPNKARISYFDYKKRTNVVIEGFIPKSKVEEIIHNNKPHIAQEKLQSLLGKE